MFCTTANLLLLSFSKNNNRSSIPYGQLGVIRITVNTHQNVTKLPVSSLKKIYTKCRKQHNMTHHNGNLEGRKLISDAITALHQASMNLLV
jgi:hypothetical protein